MNKKCALFDLDGTLFQTNEVNYQAYHHALKEQGYELDYDFYCNQCSGRHYTSFLPEILGCDKERTDVVHKRKKELYHQYLGLAKPNHHLIALLKLMRADYDVAIVTTASKENTYEILEQFQLRSCFQLIITQEDVSKTKPDPEGFLKAMAHFQKSPEDTLIFEDSDVGVAAALASGAKVVRIERGF